MAMMAMAISAANKKKTPFCSGMSQPGLMIPEQNVHCSSSHKSHQITIHHHC
jgi:hypothetical protein